MLKNDMRKMIMAGKTFEEFVEVYGEQYSKEFNEDVMKRCWKNTHKLVDEGAWHKYLKSKAASYVRYLTLINEAMEDEGILLSSTRAGAMLKTLIKKQVYSVPIGDSQ